MDDIKIIKLEPNDIIIVTYNISLDREFINNSSEALQKMFPNCIVVVNRPDIITDIQVLRNPQEGVFHK